MKFEQQLALKSIPSWATHYLNYKKLKAALYSEAEAAQGSETAEELDGFRALFLSEVERVNRRYEEQESSASQKLGELKA
ncbi:hypothetical protein GGI12_001734, partial [Dipsacomyces acuminosporus]